MIPFLENPTPIAAGDVTVDVAPLGLKVEGDRCGILTVGDTVACNVSRATKELSFRTSARPTRTRPELRLAGIAGGTTHPE